MFAKEVYVRRRETLLQKMRESGQSGLILFIGNAEAPAQYRDNCYKWRQDSTWLYYFGLDEPNMAAVLSIDSGNQGIFANDVDIDDIIWMGPQESVASKAASVGILKTAPYDNLAGWLKENVKGRTIHIIPPSRYYNTLKLMQLLGCARVDKRVSEALVKAIVSQRLIKEDIEIAAIDDACALGYEMHSVGRDSIKPGILEQEIVGKMEGVTLSKGWGVSFPTILTQHGETLHNHLHDKIIEPGKLMVIDAGAESNLHYASDFTRTYPTSGKFTAKQRDVYQIVYECNELAFSLTKPGTTYRDVHLAVARKMLDGLQALDLVHGDLDEMVACGIAGLFQPHGLGHNMGLDVHDMEDLGENLVGYDPDQTRAKQLGLGSLRMARRLVPGHVITDEPGIYFIPALIEKFKKEGLGKDFVNYAKLEGYYDFGGIRLEDDVLVTPTGARRLGPKRLPIAPDDGKIEYVMDIRIGNGYDVHAIAPGLPMWLGGVQIPSENGFVAHSDGDVAIHALCDALLGCLALGDIGHLFPDTSDEWKGVDSKILLKKVVDLVHAQQYKVGNVDITIALQRPKLAPHIGTMRETLAPILGVSADRVSIKATTTEKLGFVGRCEGCEVWASALIIKD